MCVVLVVVVVGWCWCVVDVVCCVWYWVVGVVWVVVCGYYVFGVLFGVLVVCVGWCVVWLVLWGLCVCDLFGLCWNCWGVV